MQTDSSTNSQSNSAANTTTSTIEFKTNLPHLTVLKIGSTDIAAINTALVEKSRTAPMMFAGLQVIVDLTQLNDDIDIAALKTTIMDNGINPLALMTHNHKIKQAALDNKLGWLPFIERPAKAPRRAKAEITPETAEATSATTKKDESIPSVSKKVEATAAVKPVTSEDDNGNDNKGYEPKKTAEENYQQGNDVETAQGNLILERQIRSGQRVYSKGDLTIIGSVGAGAEVIANGNIHIYGALRGRALAGAKGDESAKIFCQDMQAELLSIAGQYTYSDDIDDAHKNKPLQIALQDERIVFFPL